MNVEQIFQSKGYVPYISQDFYSRNTFIEKQGRNAEHINSTVNGKNSGWPNAAHIILPKEAYCINVIREAHEGTILNYLSTKFNELRSETFIYQPCAGSNDYQRFKIFRNEYSQCEIQKDGEPSSLIDLIPRFESETSIPLNEKNIADDTESLFLKGEIFDNNSVKSNEKSPLPPSSQIIYYGVPGSGKSNKIREQLKSVPEFQKIRCVFHPEYTNADFVGQIKPTAENGRVDYKFTPGPFAKILRRAYLNPEFPFYLEIEEINRGNAAAIFGEVFQLCDRIKPDDGKDEFGYGVGWSAYNIENNDLSDYIRDIAALDSDKINSHSIAVKQTHAYDEVVKSDQNVNTKNATSFISLEIARADFEGGCLQFSENSGIRLPPNLNILATMNTSDQNVFTLDNAFQRRFDMELVRNEFEKGDVNGFKDAAIRDQHDACIEGTDCTWGDFWEKINAKIVSLNRGLASTEDKRLGPWFVCSVAGDSAATPRKIPAKVFAEKVLKYLWDDAFKFKRPQVFAEGLTSLEQVVKKFEESPAGNLEKLKAIFKEY